MDPRGTWLCPAPAQSARFADMERRMRPVRNAAFAAWSVGGLVLAGHWGWEVFGIFAATAALVPVVDRRITASRRPENWLMLLALSGIVALGASALLSGGAHSPTLPWLAVPVVAAMAVFGTRGALVCLGAAILTAVAAGLLSSTAERPYGYEYVVATVVLLVAVGLYVHGLMRSELHHRRGSVIDPLTGLLNRTTLEARFHELCQQARVAHEPVAVAILDLDH